MVNTISAIAVLVNEFKSYLFTNKPELFIMWVQYVNGKSIELSDELVTLWNEYCMGQLKSLMLK
jgi:hypothetical protein